MKAALIGLAWAKLSLAALIVSVILIGRWVARRYIDRKSTAERAATILVVDGHREQREWEAQCSRAAHRINEKARRKASARLLQFQSRQGGTPAA